MRSGLIVVLAILTAPLPAQTSVETGGGMARLDHYSGGPFSSFRGQIHQSYGALQFAFMNTTVEHRGLGTASRTDLSVKVPIFLGDWQVNIGPQLHLARGIEMPSTRTFGVNFGVEREIGVLHLTGEYQRGLSWFGHRQSRWNVGQMALGTRLGTFKIGTSARFLAVSDSVARTDVFFDLRDPRLDTLYREQVQRVNDLGLSLGWHAGRVAVDGQYGGRFKSQTATTAWWEGNLAVRIASSLAITLSSSQLPSDPLLHMHGGRFAALGLRLGGDRDDSREKARVSADPLAIEITRSTSNLVSLRFAIPGARRTVHIIGEFSGWTPIALTRLDDGRWEARIEAMPGLYRMNVRADDGAWSVPPGMRSVADDFGGVVGLLVIPGKQENP